MSRDRDKAIEVDLRHFAAIGGMTESEYRDRMSEMISEGRLMDLLKPEASIDFGDWISEHFLDNDEEFIVAFRMSINREKDGALYCICRVDFEGKEPKICVLDVKPGYVDEPPAEAHEMAVFEVNFCDMQATI